MTLTVKPVTVRIDTAVTFNSRLYSMDGSAGTYPGPILRVKPGDMLRVTIKNELGPELASDAAKPMNTFKSFNTTNLHTHGLQYRN